jgi:hypothetical protein
MRPPSQGWDEGPEGQVLARLFGLLRSAGTHGIAHAQTLRHAEALTDAVARAGPPFTLQFVREAVFRDGVLLLLGPKNFARGRWMAGVLASAAADTLTLVRAPTPTSLLSFAAALRGSGPVPTAGVTDPSALRLGRLEAQLGVPAGVVDPALFASVELRRGIAQAAELGRQGPWPWTLGMAVVRRAESAATASVAAAMRALEAAPGPRTVPRRALTAAFYAVLCTRTLGASATVQRTVAHGTLAVCIQALEDRAGAPLREASVALFPRLLATLDPLRVDTHARRVCALVQDLSEDPSVPSPLRRVGGLVQLLYELERLRCPPGTEFDLAQVDLLSEAVRLCPSRLDPSWVRVLLQTLGALPPGARVRCPDGRDGVVLAPGRGGARPRVYVDGVVTEPSRTTLLLGEECDATS